jgi:hypothetical protein
MKGKTKMRKTVFVFTVSIVLLFTFPSLSLYGQDPAYIKAFGYGSVCVSGNGYPGFDTYNPSQFDYHDGKFFIKAKTQFDLRAFLPEGKTYGDLINDFVARKPHDSGNRSDKIYWRVFASHDVNGNKIYENFPPKPDEMLSAVTYMTSPKELVFAQLLARDVLDWKSSGASWSDEKTHLLMLCYNWLNAAKPGWQLYIVHTVGYQTLYYGKDEWIVDAPICTALIEIK